MVESFMPELEKISKNNNVETADITIEDILYPIRTVVKARSYRLQTLNTNFAVLLPSSALTWNLKRLQQDKDVSLAAKKKHANVNNIMISQHRGWSIRQPHPFRT